MGALFPTLNAAENCSEPRNPFSDIFWLETQDQRQCINKVGDKSVLRVFLRFWAVAARRNSRARLGLANGPHCLYIQYDGGVGIDRIVCGICRIDGPAAGTGPL